MKKIEFINDSAPYLSAENLNLLQDNVEESIDKINKVIVSSTEPTTGEEVWLQKGKNFVRDALYGHVNGNTGIIDTDTNWFHSQLINVKSGTPYTFSLNTTNSYQQWLWSYYQEDGTFISMDYGDFGTGNSSITKVMPSNCSKVYVGWLASANASNVQLEQGETVTSYEPYIDKKIYTKTDNGYEEFYSEENREVYSTEEQRIGTWVDGKPLYRKVISSTLASSINTIKTIATIANFDSIARFEGYFMPSGGNYFYPLPFAYNNEEITVHFYKPDGKINEAHNYTGANNLYCYAIVEYTKTTD